MASWFWFPETVGLGHPTLLQAHGVLLSQISMYVPTTLVTSNNNSFWEIQNGAD